MIKTVVEVEVTNLKVGRKYYSFDYSIYFNGHLFKQGWYESDYENGYKSEDWRYELERGQAVIKALQQI